MDLAVCLTDLTEQVDHLLAGLPDLDDVPIRVPHVAPHLPPVIVKGFSYKMGALTLPLLVAGLDVGHSQVQKAAEPVKVRGCL